MRCLYAPLSGIFLPTSLFNPIPQQSKQILNQKRNRNQAISSRICISVILALGATSYANASFSTSALDFGAVKINTTACSSSLSWVNITPGNTHTVICDSNGCQDGYKYAEVPRSVSFSTNPNVVITPASAANVPAFGTVAISNICITPSTTGDAYGSLAASVSPAFSGGLGTSENISVHVKGFQSLLQAEPLGGNLNFGTLYFNQTHSSSLSFNVFNYSSSQITITNITTGNSNFTVTSGINQAVPANGTSPATVTIKFAPTAVGSYSGTIQVTTSAGNLTYPYSGSANSAPPLSITKYITGNGTITVGDIDSNGLVKITVTPAPGNTLNGLYDNYKNIMGSVYTDYATNSFLYYLNNASGDHEIEADFVSGQFPPQQTAQVPALPPIAGFILAIGISGVMFWRKQKKK